MSESQDDIRQLLVAYTEGALDDAGLARLNALLARDPSLARRLAGAAYDRAALTGVLAVTRGAAGTARRPAPAAGRLSRAARYLLPFAAAAAIVFLLVRPGTPPPPKDVRAGGPFALAVRVDGRPARREGGTWKPLAAGGSLGPGDAVRTDAASGASLACADGVRLDLGASSEVALHREGGPLDLRAGSVRVSVAPRPAGRPFALATRHLDAAVTGTRFDATAASHRSSVAVTEGTVQVRHRDGGAPVPVKAGQLAEAFAGSPAVQVTRSPDRTAWHADARFGLLVHWGLYSVAGGAWGGKTGYSERIMQQAKIPLAEYERLAGRFDPPKFDAKSWARTAREAGARYLLFMAKHHDGFCLFDSALTDYTVVKATPFHRDPLKELAAACAEEGLRLGVGYSVPDWHHPDFPAANSQEGFHGVAKPDADLATYAGYMQGQVREILTGYGPIAVAWLVSAGGSRDVHPAERRHAQALGAAIRDLQPTALVFNPLAGQGDFGVAADPASEGGAAFDDFLKLSPQMSWNRANTTWISPEEAIRKLVEAAGSGRNLLACVGPTDQGEIPDPEVRILREVGAWLAVNGESIYGTSASPLGTPPAWGRVTTGAGRLYLHVFAWPADGTLVVPGLKAAKGASLLADPARAPLKVKPVPAGLAVSVPAAAPDPVDTVVVLETETK